jgi:hypothetical protein
VCIAFGIKFVQFIYLFDMSPKLALRLFTLGRISKQINTHNTHALGRVKTTQAELEPAPLELAGEDVTPLPPRLAICAVLLAAS